MKFSYTALSKSNKELSGLLEAATLEGAKEELHKMGLSILSVLQISESEYGAEATKQQALRTAKGVQTFIFEATDNKGKEVQGTIDAVNTDNACERLIREYQFTVHSLAPEGATDAEKKASEQQLKMLMQKYQAEIQKINKPDEDSEDVTDQRVVAEIDQVIAKTKEVIAKHAGLLSIEHQNELRNNLGELERVRQSNNLKHIAEICHTIYNLLRAADEWEKASPEIQNQFQTIIQTLGQSALINKNSALVQKGVKLNRIQTLGQSIREMAEGLTGSKGKSGPDSATLFAKIKKAFRAADKNTVGIEHVQPTATGIPTLKKIGAKLKDYLLAKNPILRQTHKHELIEAWQAYREFKKKQKEETKQKAAKSKLQTPDSRLPTQNKGILIEEIDSFVSWLLAFYVIYLFLASFSIEKNIGLPREFVLQTLKIPLLINITIFLFISHLIFFIQKRFLREQKVASLFLFSLAYSGYLLLVFNL